MHHWVVDHWSEIDVVSSDRVVNRHSMSAMTTTAVGLWSCPGGRPGSSSAQNPGVGAKAVSAVVGSTPKKLGAGQTDPRMSKRSKQWLL